MMMGPWNYGHFYGGNWWLMGIGMVVHLLFWVLVLYLGVRLIRGVGGFNEQKKCGIDNGNSAEEILRQRYARGEINRDELNEMMNELRK